jgi:hypothetical protein
MNRAHNTARRTHSRTEIHAQVSKLDVPSVVRARWVDGVVQRQCCGGSVNARQHIVNGGK